MDLDCSTRCGRLNADYTDYLERMNTHTYEIVDAALRHPDILIDVWGPGWKGYDPALPLSVNVKRRQARLSQLERSRRENDDAVEEKRRMGLVPEQNYPHASRRPDAPEAVDERQDPPWNELDDETICGDMIFEAAWTISWVDWGVRSEGH